MITYDDASPQKRAERVLLLRRATLMPRTDFCKKYNLSRGTLQNWESARYGGLSSAGAKKLIKTFQAEGIACSIEWLLYNTGTPPVIPGLGCNNKQTQAITAPMPKAEPIILELQCFHQLHPFGIDTIIPDEAMAPVFAKGDLVAGKRIINKTQFSLALGLDCIVQTTEGKTLVRRLQNSDNENQPSYKLVPMDTSFPDLENASIETIAPVIWIRKI